MIKLYQPPPKNTHISRNLENNFLHLSYAYVCHRLLSVATTTDMKTSNGNETVETETVESNPLLHVPNSLPILAP